MMEGKFVGLVPTLNQLMGNSIPDYMSVDGFQAMVDAVFAIRQDGRK